ncbi:PTS sugar transporter subunit IIA [Burkholderia sp. WP9]|uniref:PTS sugar transporter subunit IIA n=1 Tax=Burkholderia sp. WP9 TaxID=1500263 RepID=UPI0025711C24|nr:PTS sugar transporter subunit IIA [Burkholderia sp. WP9]
MPDIADYCDFLRRVNANSRSLIKSNGQVAHMTRALVGLRTFFGMGKASPQGRSRSVPSRNVMMRVTLDAQHATPLRQALIRDCGDQQWTIRVAPLHGTGRVRLSLYLPKDAVNGAMQRLAHLAPTAEVGQLLEIPQAPTNAWRALMHTPSQPRADSSDYQAESVGKADTLAQLLAPDHVLLGWDVADRETLFEQFGHFFEQRYDMPATSVTTGLMAREALGSTGLGQGVAVPHGQIRMLRHAMAFYVRPAQPIPFDAPDGQPVSDVIVLLVPEWANSTHLLLLADVAQRFCDHQFRELLHRCIDARAVSQLFASYEAVGDVGRRGPHTNPAGDPPAGVKRVRPRG